MKILYVCAYFYPENTAFSHLEKDLLTALTSAGHQVDVVCPVPTRGISAEVREEYRKRRQEELYGGRVHVHRFWAPQERKNPVVRALRYFWCNFQMYRLGKKNKDIDLLLATSTPPTQGVLAGCLKRRLRCPSIYYMQDIFPDSLIYTGLAKRDSLLWKIGRAVENYTYHHADHVVVISEDFRRNIMEKGVPEQKIEVIYNWINEKQVQYIERDKNPLFDAYGLSRDKFYVAYSGNIGHSQNIDMLLDAAKELQSHAEIGFLVVGDGAQRLHMADRIEKEQITNVTMMPYQPYENISQVFSLGDVGLLISKSGIGSNSVPSKTWSYLSAQRPVLASFDLDSELCQLIEREKLGVCVAPDDPDALVQAVLQLSQQRETLPSIGERCRTYILDHLTARSATDQWLRLLDRINKTHE